MNVRALKSVRQRFVPSGEIRSLMEAFRRMTNECISIGLAEVTCPAIYYLSSIGSSGTGLKGVQTC
jgi:hypothetical protein